MSYRLKEGENILEITPQTAQNLDISRSQDGSIHILHNNSSYRAENISVDSLHKTVSITLNGREYSFTIEDNLDQLIDKMGLSTVDNEVSKEVKAPMPGLILDIMVKPGQAVLQGDSLLILEAMKMENVIKAEADTIVAEVKLSKGDTVEKNQVILVFE